MFKRLLQIYALPVLLSLGYTLGLGFWDYLLEVKDLPIFIIIFILNTYFFIFIKQCRFIALKSILIFCCLLLVTYIASATGFLQGHMSLGIMASVLQTNQNEALEFLSVIHLKYWIYGFCLLLLTLYYFFVQPLYYSIRLRKLPVFFLLGLNIFNIFGVQTIAATIKYHKEEKKLNAENSPNADWKISSIQPKYDNQIVVIGESVERDFLSLYGYDKKTTSFLDQAPVTRVKQYISTAPNTATSLIRTLAYMNSQRDIDVGLNVVTLAKQAKYNTIWISNQGFLGKNDTAVSKIAIHADHTFFMKTGNYMSNNIDDDKLLDIVEKQLEKYKDRNNVIFIHMMGSHPDACERLFKQPRLYPDQSETINCYLSSINKLDHFIEQTYNILSKSKRSFHLSYFSDHGMTVTSDGYNVDNKFKHNYDVPFFMFSSDEKKRVDVDKTISAYDFMNIYAGFLGVKTPYLDANRDLEHIPNNDHVWVFDWDNYVSYQSLQ